MLVIRGQIVEEICYVVVHCSKSYIRSEIFSYSTFVYAGELKTCGLLAEAANSMILRLPLFRHNCAMFVNKYSVTGEQINILLQGVLLVFHILYNTR